MGRLIRLTLMMMMGRLIRLTLMMMMGLITAIMFVDGW